MSDNRNVSQTRAFDPARYRHPEIARADHEARLAREAANEAATWVDLYETEQRNHDAEAERLARDGRPIVENADLLAGRAATGSGVVRYHPAPDPVALREAREKAEKLSKIADKAEAKARRIAAESPPYDPAEAARELGTSLIWERDLKFAGRFYVRGEPVPADVWNEIPAAKRQSLQNLRFVSEVVA